MICKMSPILRAALVSLQLHACLKSKDACIFKSNFWGEKKKYRKQSSSFYVILFQKSDTFLLFLIPYLKTEHWNDGVEFEPKPNLWPLTTFRLITSRIEDGTKHCTFVFQC